MKTINIILLMFVISCISITSSAQEVNLVNIRETLLNSTYGWFDISGHYLYASTGYGIKVFDISTFSDPQEIIHIPTYGLTGSIMAEGEYLYVTDFNEGLLVFNIDDPENPVYLSSFNAPGNTRSILNNGDYIYLFAESEGIQIIDASDPYNLSLEEVIYTSGNAQMGAIAGNYMYVSVAEPGLAIYNIANPGSPQLVNTWNTLSGIARGLSVSPDNSFLLMGDWMNGVYVLNLSNPIFPAIAANLSYPGEFAMFTSGQQTYGICSYYKEGLQSFNYSGVELDSLYLGGNGYFIVNSGYAYVGQNDTLWVIDCEPPQSMSIESHINDLGFPYDAAVQDDYVYVANHAGGLAVLDAADPTNPILLDSMAVNLAAFDVCVHPDSPYVYVADFNYGLKVFNNSDQEHPILIDSVATDPDPYAIKVIYRDGYIYVVVISEGINVFSAADPAHPVFLFNINIGNITRECDVTTDGNYLYSAAFEDGMMVHQLFLPDSASFIVSNDNFEAAYSLEINDNYCYLADYYKGLFVFDINNPAYPIMLDSIPPASGACAIRVINDQYVAVGDYVEGVFIADVSNPMDIFEVSRMENYGVVQSMAIKDNYLLVCDHYSLIFADIYYNGIENPKSSAQVEYPILYPAYPNPFNCSALVEYEIRREGQVKLTLYNSLGQEAAVLADNYLSAGRYKASVDGVNIPSGIYFIKLETCGTSEIRKIILMK